ncbi:hypothetical protein H8K47_04775 [Undibacterium sp. CY7W]|uniref:Uncharacterized protein n=1 Tax=Undibacterium rugosum TaxID=2762291 RepID=A0A923HZ44_9BURK|nr:hypothetical protein [Undibacterium rugosum]MBR7779784.1 hypothetical protein [Undibacterium rugosum]
MSAAIVFTSCALSAHADGLNDLKTALARLHGSVPVKAQVETRINNRIGEGKELEESAGQASIQLEDGNRGLQLVFPKELLSKLEAEERAKEKDPKAKTPALTSIKELSPAELRPAVNYAAALLRKLERAQFKGEKADNYNGKPARLLNFELSIDRLSEKEKKYIKKYEGSFDVWVDADGTPLASRSSQQISGRAFVVVSFEIHDEDNLVYTVTGDRLLVQKKERKNMSSGTGERSEMRAVTTLNILS